MNLKIASFVIQDRELKNLKFAKEYPTLEDLMIEQGVSTELANYRNKDRDDNSQDPNYFVCDD